MKKISRLQLPDVYKGDGELNAELFMGSKDYYYSIVELKSFGEFILKKYGVNKEVKFCDILKFRENEK